MKKAMLFSCILLILCMALGGAGFSSLGGADGSVTVKAEEKSEPKAVKAVKESRPADRTAIRKAVASFVKAFESGDIDATVGHLTSGAEVTADDALPTGRLL